MSRELISVIEQISREKGINSETIIGAVKSALQVAAKKCFGASDNIQVEIDPKSGEIQVILTKMIVADVTNPKEEISLEEAKKIDAEAELGDEIGALIEVGDFGRIAAQTAKQVIFQKVREAEWDTVYRDFINRQGDIVHGVILGRRTEITSLTLERQKPCSPTKSRSPERHSDGETGSGPFYAR